MKFLLSSYSILRFYHLFLSLLFNTLLFSHFHPWSKEEETCNVFDLSYIFNQDLMVKSRSNYVPCPALSALSMEERRLFCGHLPHDYY